MHILRNDTGPDQAITKFLDVLREIDPEVKTEGSRWKAKCPAHDDQNPSLSISQGHDGRVLIKCFAGCEAEDICAAMGMGLSDLMPSVGQEVQKITSLQKSKRTFSFAEDAIACLERKHGSLASSWDYFDSTGKRVGVILRWNKPDGKVIRPLSLVDGRWHIAAMKQPGPLYRLPEIAAFRQIYIVEGEKAADAAARIGLLATTSSGGGNAASKTDWSPLAGKEIVILPDNDSPGRKYAEEVCRELSRLSPPPSIKVVRLPGLPPGGDIFEFIASQDTTCATVIRQRISAIVESQEFRPATPLQSGPDLIRMDSIESRPVRWLWRGRLPFGSISLLVGVPGAGKSYLTVDLAARISTGTSFPDGSTQIPGSVIMISAEDHPKEVLRPRLDAHAADPSKIHLLRGQKIIDAGQQKSIDFSLRDVDVLKEAIQRVGDCRLLIIDPVGSFLGSRIDAHRDNEVRSVLAPVARLAEEHGVAVLIVMHRRKGNCGSADEAALGSRAFTGIARSVLHLTLDPQNPSRRLLLAGKNNLAASASGLAFSVAGDPPKLEWEPDPVEMSADEAMSRERTDSGELSALDEAINWLKIELSPGPQETAKIQCKAKSCGISTSTLNRAKAKLKVQSNPDGFQGKWVLQLPQTSLGPDFTKDSSLANSGDTDKVCQKPES
jgi:putative DNA primase/helicase